MRRAEISDKSTPKCASLAVNSVPLRNIDLLVLGTAYSLRLLGSYLRLELSLLICDAACSLQNFSPS